MRSKRTLRSSFVVTVAATGALLGGCGGSVVTNGNPAPPDAGPDDSGNPNGCPAQEPSVHTPCSLPSTEMCHYGSACSPFTYACENASWVFVSTNPPAPVCPPTQPQGSCECYPSTLTCMYPNGMCNGQPVYAQVACSGGQWTGSSSSCNPPEPDSGFFDATSGEASTVDAHTIDAMRGD